MNSLNISAFHNAYISGNSRELDRLWAEVAPSRLIKFFPAKYDERGKNYFIDHLKDEKMWLSSPSCFNDPFDSVINFDCRDYVVGIGVNALSRYVGTAEAEKMMESDRGKAMVKMIGDSLQRDIDVSHKRLEKRIYATCFSEPDNLYSLRMWGHYANNHSGVCAEYTFQDVKNSTPFACIPIKYTNLFEYEIFPQNISEDTRNCLKLYTKAQEWANEKEWRVCHQVEAPCGNGFSIPFALPKKIYLGCKAENRLKEDIVNICSGTAIEIYQMEMRKNSFLLDVKQLV